MLACRARLILSAAHGRGEDRRFMQRQSYIEFKQYVERSTDEKTAFLAVKPRPCIGISGKPRAAEYMERLKNKKPVAIVATGC